MNPTDLHTLVGIGARMELVAETSWEIARLTLTFGWK